MVKFKFNQWNTCKEQMKTMRESGLCYVTIIDKIITTTRRLKLFRTSKFNQTSSTLSKLKKKTIFQKLPMTNKHSFFFVLNCDKRRHLFAALFPIIDFEETSAPNAIELQCYKANGEFGICFSLPILNNKSKKEIS